MLLQQLLVQNHGLLPTASEYWTFELLLQEIMQNIKDLPVASKQVMNLLSWLTLLAAHQAASLPLHNHGAVLLLMTRPSYPPEVNTTSTNDTHLDTPHSLQVYAYRWSCPALPKQLLSPTAVGTGPRQ